MRMHPNFQGAKPRKWFWIASLIPCVSFYGNGFCLGFVWSIKREWHPVMKGWCIAHSRRGYWIRPHPWSIPKVKVIKKV